MGEVYDDLLHIVCHQAFLKCVLHVLFLTIPVTTDRIA